MSTPPATSCFVKKLFKKKSRTFKEFLVIELGELAKQGIVTGEVVKSVERHLEGILEELKRKKEAETRQFLITSDLKEVGSEILTGRPQIEYVEREEIEKSEWCTGNYKQIACGRKARSWEVEVYAKDS